MGAATPEGASGPRSRWREAVGYGLITVSIWLAWEVVKVPFVERAPGPVALRVAPMSPEARRRAAEAALTAGDFERASALAGQSLSMAPFNARALRVRGLAEARADNLYLADQLLTLAGNWSLRDDPAHSWLIQHRLRRGDYASSFAHADTLARRRGDLHPQLFNLFTVAALADPRALQALIRTLATDSPWRLPYIDYLISRPDTDALILALGLALNNSSHPLTDYENGQIYRSWVAERRFNAVRALAASRKGATTDTVANGDFSAPLSPDLLPLGWNLGIGPGMMVQIVPGGEPGGQALNVHYSGYAAANLVEQLILLEPGRYVLSAAQTLDGPAEETHLRWTIRCADTNEVVLDHSLPGGAASETLTVRAEFQTPADACAAQWLRLETRPADRRFTTSLTISRVLISRITS